MLEIAISFFAIFDKNHIMVREKVIPVESQCLKQAIGLNMLRGPQ